MVGPVLIITTIIMTLLMFTVALLAIVFAAKNKNELNRSMRSLTVLFFAYFIFAFLHFYFQNINVSLISVTVLRCLSDLCFCLMVVWWLDVIVAFSDRKPVISRKVLLAISLVYIAVVEIIVLFKGAYSATKDLIIPEPVWRYTVISLNIAFSVLAVVLACIYLYRTFKYLEKGFARNGSIFFSVLLILYMLWITLFDFQTVTNPGSSIADVVMDPVLIAYCIIDIVIIALFFRKDPLALFADHSEADKTEQVQQFSEAAGLTKRETDVLRLVCSGLNNPEIAEELFIAENTVKRHINNIFQKAEVKNRYELITKVFSNGN